MSHLAQKRLAVLGALSFVGLVAVANAQLVTAAFRSQPDCVAVDGAATPSKRVC